MANNDIQKKLVEILELARSIESEVRAYPSRSATKKSEVLSMLQGIKDEAYIAGLTIDKMGME